MIITETRDFKKAQAYCLRLLMARDYTVFQIRQKLIQKEYSEEIADAMIDYLSQMHYLDDERYANYYVYYRQQHRSKRIIRQDLMRKGVSKEIIEQALEEMDQEQECLQIQEWVRKRNFDPQTADLKEKNRFYQFLQRKGYSYSDIRKALEICEY